MAQNLCSNPAACVSRRIPAYGTSKMSGTARGIHSGVDTLPRRGTSVTPKSVGDRSLEYLLEGGATLRASLDRHGEARHETAGVSGVRASPEKRLHILLLQVLKIGNDSHKCFAGSEYFLHNTDLDALSFGSEIVVIHVPQFGQITAI